MKIFHFLILGLFLVPFSTVAQKKMSKRERQEAKARKELNLKYFNEIFGKNDKDFERSKADAQWKDDPVVILCQKTHISFLRKPGDRASRTKGVIRKRILIQDKAALEDFSEFYFQEALAIGIRHIKPDGTQRDISIEDAIKVETDVPKFYSDSYSSEEYYKIAIADLEVGDILDYFKVFSEEYSSNIELINTIGAVYPIEYQEIIFDIDKWSFFYGTFNGAPEFVQDEAGGVNHRGKRKTSVERFILKDSNRAGLKDERWTFTYITEPIYKIMAVPPKGYVAGKRITNLTRKKLSVKATMQATLQEAKKSIKTSTLPASSRRYMKDWKVKNRTPKEIVRMLYYVNRYSFIRSASFNSVASNGLSSTDKYIQMRSDYFAYLFASELKHYKIEAELVAAVPRYYGEVENVVTEDEIKYGVYVPKTKSYYWPIDNYRTHEDPFISVLGASAYRMPFKELSKSSPNFKKVKLPSSNFQDNVHATSLEISINEDNSLSVIGEKAYTGTFKDYYSYLLLLQTDYFDNDNYEISSESDQKKILANRKKEKKVKPKKKRRVKKSRQEYLDGLKQKKLEVSERKKEIIEDWLKDDYEMEELQDFEVTTYGRFAPDDLTLGADMTFTSKGYLKKAGPNLILEVGRFITGQVELEEDEIKERTFPIDQSYARTIVNTIRIILPEGYTAQGIDGMKFNVDNPYAAFVSTVSQEGNTLSIKTTKTYKQEHIEKENWNGMVEMLEAAYDFSQKKIVLKKQ